MTRKQKLGALTIVTSIALLQLDVAGAADMTVEGSYFKKHRKVASLEYVSDVQSDCRVGWWQTLRSGHVRPRWGMRCR